MLASAARLATDTFRGDPGFNRGRTGKSQAYPESSALRSTPSRRLGTATTPLY
jgi:hypothetical protein